MYIEHPYFYDGKYYAKVDGKMIEITKEVAYAMNNFYRSSLPRRVAVKNEKGEVTEKKVREIPFSATTDEDNSFSIEEYPDMNGDVEEKILAGEETRTLHQAINLLDTEERMLVYAVYFENKTQAEVAAIMGVSQQMVAYKLKKVLSKMRWIYQKNNF